MNLIFVISLLLTYSLAAQTVRICLVEQQSKLSLEFSGNFILEGEDAKYLFNQLNTPLSIRSENDMVWIEAAGDYSRALKYKQGAPLRFIAHPNNPNGFITIGSKIKEHGPLKIYLNDEGKFQLVVERNLEEYLKYVVPHEILASRDVDKAAIKAQTVAARTYVMAHLKPDNYFDVYADVRDQMYVSANEPNQLVLDCIHETKAEVLTFENKLIPARFCSSLGGVQEKPLYLSSSEAPVSYMTIGTKVVGTLSPHFRWERVFTPTELHAKLRAWFPNEDYNTDSLTEISLSIEINERSVSGRTTELMVKTKQFSRELKGLDIRRFFSQDGKILPSNLFVLVQENNVLKIQGGGNGHGLGMGQWEAMELSRDGLNYQEILAFFYPQSIIGILK